jgi:hypothetical protein
MGRPEVNEAFQNDPDDPRHGTNNGYTNLGCGCDKCREAHNAYHLDYMRRHPEQYHRASLRERHKRDPDGSKAARRDAEWRERQVNERKAQLRREERAEAKELILRLHAEGWGYRQIIKELWRLDLPYYDNPGSISHIVKGYRRKQ